MSEKPDQSEFPLPAKEVARRVRKFLATPGAADSLWETVREADKLGRELSARTQFRDERTLAEYLKDRQSLAPFRGFYFIFYQPT